MFPFELEVTVLYIFINIHIHTTKNQHVINVSLQAHTDWMTLMHEYRDIKQHLLTHRWPATLGTRLFSEQSPPVYTIIPT